MANTASPLVTVLHRPRRSSPERQKVLRWATVTLLLLLAAVAASRA